ncbi:SusC/RagA family TonB-linked outer membrane protein [Pedobacter sp. SD-b]|uniref:SusC/RagA family TonB-linked outer membrane protein n=1 Tax=Pedobacter segetis TaxID=2793069 RepID=A0ABS1BMQ0_9SPHI|nr:SusC/RagA family TonB-linked outer membrane protein [Pedobacter segetis]MBK0384136.1 SusC/RagA family TonB-linked outer membrane protein [Pedobacter segetis]
MYKIYKIKATLLCSAFALFTTQLKAQKKENLPAKVKAQQIDSLKVINIPNRFFNDSEDRSTAAISTIRTAALYKTPSTSVSNSLYALPGLNTQQTSGEPGFEDANLNIRGNGTYGYTNGGGYNTETIYVDGFEVNATYFNYMSASEIESISVLKDAAALATFGMKGANGVLWVTTKRGHEGKSTITFKARTGLDNAIDINKPLGSYDFANLYNIAKSNDNGNVWSPTYSPAQLNAYKDGTGTNVDWFAKTLKDNAPYTDANLILSGGDKTSKYNVVFGYVDKQGLYNVSNTDSTANESYGRYNLRANLDFDLGNIFAARIDLNGRIEKRISPNYTSGFSTNKLWTDLYNYPSNIYPVYDDANNINLSGTGLYPNNPVGSITKLGYQSNTTRFLQGNFGLREKLDFITKGLYADESFSYNSYDLSSYSKTRDYARYIGGSTTTTNQNTNLKPTSNAGLGQQDWRQLLVTVGYKGFFGKSELNSAINYQQSAYTGEGTFGYKVNYQNISGRVNYAYNNKYIAEFGFSEYGSDAFAPGNRFHFYPSISGAWIVSKEDFLKNSIAITQLKLRASVGKSATDKADGPGTYGSGAKYLYQQFYGYTGVYYTGNGTPAGNGGLYPLFIANPNYGPEESMKYNVGADLMLFKKLNVTLDAYLDKRTGILTQDNSIPGSFGNYTYFDNIGKMTNKGLEVSATYNGKLKEVGYQLFGSLSFNKNKIDFQSEIPTAFPYNASTGRPFGSIIGLVSDGFYQIEDFNPDGSLKAGLPTPLFGAIQPGDLKYKDLDKNGKVDALDVTQIGKPYLPTTNFSFGGTVDFKGFDLSALFQGVTGNSINLLGNSYTRAQNIAFVNNTNVYANAEGSWAYYPAQGIDTRATATYPRLTTSANNNNYTTSSFWIKDGDFLRLRNVEVGYNFSKYVVTNLRLQKLRLFVNAINPVTWSKLKNDYNLDPEYTSGYPTIKSYTIGLIATF